MFEILLPAAILVGVVGTIAKIPVYWTVDKTQEIYYEKKYGKPHYQEISGKNYEEKQKTIEYYESERFDKELISYNWQTLGDNWNKVSSGDYVKWPGFIEYVNRTKDDFKIGPKWKALEVEGVVQLNEGVGVVNKIEKVIPESDNMKITVSFPIYNLKHTRPKYVVKNFYWKTDDLTFDDLLFNQK